MNRRKKLTCGVSGSEGAFPPRHAASQRKVRAGASWGIVKGFRVAVCVLLAGASGAACSAAADTPAGFDGTVRIGAILPLTGTFSTYGGPLRDAADMAVDRVNARGGFTVAGKRYRVSLKVYDDGTQWEKNIPVIFPRAVLRDKVPFLITAWNTYVVAPFLNDDPVPTVDVLAATWEPPVTELSPQIFLLRPFTPDIIPGVPHYISRKLGARRLAYLGPNEPFANGQLASLRATAAANGVELVKAVRYPPESTDVSSFIAAALAGNPQALHVGGSTQAVAPVLTQLYQKGVRLPISMYTGMTPDQASDLIGANQYNQVMANVYEYEGVTPQTNPVPAAQRFGTDFQKRYDIYGIDLIQWAYDAVWIAKAAMEQAGTVTDRAAIRQAMLRLTVPPDSVTGWIPRAGGRLFSDRRQAASLSVALDWDTGSASWKPAFYYTAGLPGQTVTPRAARPPTTP